MHANPHWLSIVDPPAQRLRGRSPVFVLIEEGIGTYLSKAVWRDASRIDAPGGGTFVARLRREVEGALVSSLRGAATGLHALRREYLLVREGGKLRPDEQVASSFRRALARRGARHAGEPLIEGESRPSVLMLTQPFSEYGQIALEEEVRVLATLADAGDALGVRVLVKPHPREDTSKYDGTGLRERVEFARGNFPAEEILESLAPLAVVGYNSTTLLNASLMYGIPSVSLIGAVTLNADAGYGQSVREFRDVCRDFVAFPATLDAAVATLRAGTDAARTARAEAGAEATSPTNPNDATE